MATSLRRNAVTGCEDPRPLLAMAELFGDIRTDPSLVGAVARWLSLLYRHGSRATLEQAAAELEF